MDNLNRRGFLGALASAPASFSGIGRSLAGRVPLSKPRRTQYDIDGPGSMLADREEGTDPWDVYSVIGIPDVVKERLHEDASPHVCDPDLDTLRSVSPVMKYRIQHRRNYERSLKRHMNSPVRRKLTRKLTEKYGLAHWW